MAPSELAEDLQFHSRITNKTPESCLDGGRAKPLGKSKFITCSAAASHTRRADILAGQGCGIYRLEKHVLHKNHFKSHKRVDESGFVSYSPLTYHLIS